MLEEIITCLGGADNIITATNCMTRLRITVSDEAKVEEAGLRNCNDGHGYCVFAEAIQQKAAGYYKAFLLLLCVVVTIDIVMDLICGEMNVWLISKITLYAVKVILLLVLAFWKDLGKKKTFCICYIIFAIDVVGLAMELLYMSETGFYIDPIIGVTAALIADGTIELSVNGKYKDKEMRGSN